MKGLSMFAKMSIGIVATVVVAAAIFLLGIRPTLANIDEHEKHNAQLEAKVARIPEGRALVALAEQKVKEAERKLARYENQKMPVNTIDLSDRLSAWEQYHDMVREIGHKLQAWPMKTGVNRQFAVQLPPPPTDPNALPDKLIAFPLGAVTVRASSFQGLLDHVKRWNRIPNLLVLTDGMAIQGTTPQLTATYNLTVYVYPRARGGQLGAPVPSIPGGGGGGGFGGGMPGGGMGAPGGMPGGIRGPGAGGV